MKPLVVHEVAAGILFWAVAGVWMVGEMAFAIRTTLRDRETRDPSFVWLTLASTAGLAMAVVAAHRVDGLTMPGPGWLPVGLGLALVTGGLALRVWAIRELGRFFKFTVVVQEGHEVIQSGPYRRIRHPSYTGLIVAAVGLGVMLGNWLSVVLSALPPLVGFTIRLLHEERVLADELGEPYRDYMSRTWRLVPGIW